MNFYALVVAPLKGRWRGRSEWDERAHHLRALAPRAEAAMDASGLGSYEKLWPMALGGGVMSDDLSELIFDFSWRLLVGFRR